MYNLDRVRIIITTHPRTTNVSKGSECSMKHGLKLQRLPRSETKSRLSNGLMQLKVSSQGNHPIRKEKQQLRHWATVMQLCSETPTRPRAISTCLPPGEAWRVLCNLCSVHCMITFSEPPWLPCLLVAWTFDFVRWGRAFQVLPWGPDTTHAENPWGLTEWVANKLRVSSTFRWRLRIIRFASE